ncbi:MAG: 2-oxoglutarate dehydrogenase E1 component, partial [Alphaproteobacteria bacterium]|nr:2-oxoglutarate dehydrogenase E1 component [Alphaproteobacteria bacterium]
MARFETNGGAGPAPAGARSPQNDFLASTSFLQGANAAYLESLLAAYESDPSSISPDWRNFFAEMGIRPGEKLALGGPSWARRDWPQPANGEWVKALAGEAPAPVKAPAAPAAAPAPIGEDVLRATRDSVRALMMIRAYRMRGHLHANLDPLGLEQRHDHGELNPQTYGFTDEDYERKIFLDGVLGMRYATLFEMVTILRRTYCGTIGFEFMHITNPEEKAWLQARIEGPKKEIVFTQ